jgi:2-polyprenyl-3-methyl-5-hydroxy-6-metoxy-1,4-benzoquinol methylase
LIDSWLGFAVLARHRVPEIMDDPSLAADLHHDALTGVARLNSASFAESLIWQAIDNLAKQMPGKQIALLDIATGGGDIPIKLFQLARRKNIRLEIEACDISETALSKARENARLAKADIKFFQACALSSTFQRSYDVVVTNLFTHHLDPENVIVLMNRMKAHADRLVLIDDLSRSSINYGLIYIASRIFSNCAVVHHDGPASVRAAYTQEEMLEMAKQAGLSGARIKRHFPCRFLLEAETRNGKEEGR